MESLRIHLFGGFLLEQGERALPPVASRVGRSLFAYLVINRGRGHQRDLLAGSFWPDLPEGRARRRLSHTLWQIQDVLGELDGSEPHLLVTADSLAFNPSAPYWLDVEEFDRLVDGTEAHPRDRAADPEALRECVELYRGDFLAGFYDEWVSLPQTHYRDRYLTALTRLVEVSKSLGGYEEALGYARRLTHHDPFRESAHQEVMRLCFLLGRVNEAIQQYERCSSVLVEELGTEPSEATTELYRKVQRYRRAGLRPTTGEKPAGALERRGEVPFVGRVDERRTLVDQLERVLGGGGGVVLIEGEPGVGKTRLTREMADDAGWRGFEVLWGGCEPGAARPYAPLAELLTAGVTQLRAEQLAEQMEGVWLGEVARLVPTLGDWLQDLPGHARLRSEEESSRMQEALVETLLALGRIKPHLVVVDDIHWADDDTLRALERLGRRLEESQILVILSFRSEEGRGDPTVWDTLRNLDRIAGLGRVVLAPLSVFELGEMVKRALGLTRVESSLAARMHRETGGNALFALETLHTLQDEGVLDGGSDPVNILESRLGAREIPLSDRVRRIIEARSELLGAPARRLLAAVSVISRAAGIEVLATTTGLPRPTVVDAVEDLLNRHMVRAVDGEYLPSHDQVRQAVYEGLDPGMRRELHLGAGRALEEQEPEAVETIAHHFTRAGVPDRAAHYLVLAADRAVDLHAYETAARHLAAAGDLADEAGWTRRERYGLSLRRESVLDVLGRRQEQAGVLDTLSELGEEADRADLERRRAWYLAHTARFREAEAAARRSVALAQERRDGEAVAAALIALGMSLRWAGRAGDAVGSLERAIETASDDSLLKAEAHTALGNTLTELQEYEAAAVQLRTALGKHESRGDLRGQAEVLGILATASMEQGRTDDATTLRRQALDLCRRIGYRHGQGVNLVNLGNLLYLHGRPVEALSSYAEAAGIFSAMANERGRAMALVNGAAVRHTILGDDDRARTDAEEARSAFERLGDEVGVAQCLEIIAGVERRAGRHESARRLLEESLDKLRAAGNRWMEAQHLRSLAELSLDLHEWHTALLTAERATRMCEDAGLEELAVDLLAVRAAALLGAGDPEHAYELTSQAISSLSAGVERPHVMMHRHALAAHAVDDGEEARRADTEAYRLLARMLVELDDDARRRAIDTIAEHRAIADTWAEMKPRVVEIDLAVADAPTGRVLHDDERRKVAWTVAAPEDDIGADPIENRRRKIVRLLAEARGHGTLPTLDQLAWVLDVSASTVRRDVSALRATGHQVETRGSRTAS